MQYATMQSLFDSLCQCLGSTATLPRDGSDPVSSAHVSTPDRMRYDGNSPVTENPNASPATRRTNRLELKDPQWDALFDAVSPSVNNKLVLHTHRHGGSPDSSPESSPRGRPRSPPENSLRVSSNNAATVETAHVLAKAKQAANPSRYRMSAPKEAPKATAPKSHKRKRPVGSRDDIFRSRKNVTSVRRSGCPGEGQCYNPISRFLTNHQGFANALCFATPVRDEDEMEEEFKDNDHNDNNSLASDANTLNTCEDSMLLLDHKLAQMSQNQPPMPLFHDFKVNQNEPEGLRRIVDSDTHNSANLLLLWRQRPEEAQPPQADVLPSSSSSSSSGGTSRGHARARLVPPQPIPEHELPPPMKAASTSSSGSSCRSSRHTGEI